MTQINHKKLHILLVEDDEVDIMTVQRAFSKNKVSNPLYIAKNGIEALEMLRNTHKDRQIPSPRIILMDVNMPKMGGIECLDEIRKDEKLKNSNVFMLSTSNDDRDKLKAYNLNVAGYILKPVQFEEFVAAVATLNAYWELCEQP
jgi:CheY-like chemotaxis protein